MLKPVKRATAVLTALALGMPALADVTLSASNNPTVTLNERLGALFGAERAVLTSFGSDDLDRLIRVPTAIPGKTKVPSEAQLAASPVASGGKNWSCLTEALYFEARGEKLEGVIGVAEVILNRTDGSRYPDTICAVVNQGTGERHRCQFSYTCDGRPETIGEQKAYERVGRVARMMMDGAPRILTDGATHYHTKSVSPRWSRVFERTATIGYHHLYREEDRIARN